MKSIAVGQFSTVTGTPSVGVYILFWKIFSNQFRETTYSKSYIFTEVSRYRFC